MKNTLDLSTKLRIVESIKKKLPLTDTSVERLAKELEEELQIPITAVNIRNILQAMDVKIQSALEDSEVIDVLINSILTLFVKCGYLPEGKFLQLVIKKGFFTKGE